MRKRTSRLNSTVNNSGTVLKSTPILLSNDATLIGKPLDNIVNFLKTLNWNSISDEVLDSVQFKKKEKISELAKSTLKHRIQGLIGQRLNEIESGLGCRSVCEGGEGISLAQLKVLAHFLILAAADDQNENSGSPNFDDPQFIEKYNVRYGEENSVSAEVPPSFLMTSLEGQSSSYLKSIENSKIGHITSLTPQETEVSRNRRRRSELPKTLMMQQQSSSRKSLAVGVPQGSVLSLRPSEASSQLLPNLQEVTDLRKKKSGKMLSTPTSAAKTKSVVQVNNSEGGIATVESFVGCRLTSSPSSPSRRRATPVRSPNKLTSFTSPQHNRMPMKPFSGVQKTVNSSPSHIFLTTGHLDQLPRCVKLLDRNDAFHLTVISLSNDSHVQFSETVDLVLSMNGERGSLSFTILVHCSLSIELACKAQRVLDRRLEGKNKSQFIVATTLRSNAETDVTNQPSHQLSNNHLAYFVLASFSGVNNNNGISPRKRRSTTNRFLISNTWCISHSSTSNREDERRDLETFIVENLTCEEDWILDLSTYRPNSEFQLCLAAQKLGRSCVVFNEDMNNLEEGPREIVSKATAAFSNFLHPNMDMASSSSSVEGECWLDLAQL